MSKLTTPLPPFRVKLIILYTKGNDQDNLKSLGWECILENKFQSFVWYNSLKVVFVHCTDTVLTLQLFGVVTVCLLGSLNIFFVLLFPSLYRNKRRNGCWQQFLSLVKSTRAFKTKGNYPRSLQRFLLNGEGDWSANENKTGWELNCKWMLLSVFCCFMFFFSWWKLIWGQVSFWHGTISPDCIWRHVLLRNVMSFNTFNTGFQSWN